MRDLASAAQEKITIPHGYQSCAKAYLGDASTEMRTEEAPDQPARWKWQKHMVNYDRVPSVDHGS